MEISTDFYYYFKNHRVANTFVHQGLAFCIVQSKLFRR